jgi:hypothetical protein
MNSPIKAPINPSTAFPLKALRGALLLAILCLASLQLAPAAGAVEGTALYQPESEQAFQQQLAAGEIRSAVINKRVRSVRLTMKDGRHLLVKYPPKQEPRVHTELRARGVHVSILAKTQALKEVTKKPVKHKLRYIVGGVVLVVIVVVGGVLLVKRRRAPV